MKNKLISTLLLVSMLSGCEFIEDFLSMPVSSTSSSVGSSTKVESSSSSSSTSSTNSTNSSISISSSDNEVITSSTSNSKEDYPISSSNNSSSSSSSSSQIIYEEVLDVTGFTFIEKANEYYISGYDSNLKSVCKLPTKYNDKDVIGVSKNAFKNNETIKELVISYTIKDIEESAFEKCNLEKITLNGHVNLMSKSFYKCFALKEIDTTNGGFTNIGEYAFYNCSNLVTLDFSNSIYLEKIDSYAFYNCVKLKNTSMPSSLKEIGVKSFYHCTLFKSLSFKNDSQLTIIREAAFENCSTLETVYIPYKVEMLEKNPFGYCQKLLKISTLNGPNGETGKYTSFLKNGSYSLLERETYDLVINPSGKSSLDGVKLSSNTKNIQPYAFRGCNHLANIEIPETIESIGENAFFGVEAAMTINIPKSNQYYSYDAFGFYNYNKTEYISYGNFGSSNKTECEIAASIEKIHDYAFFNAKYLTKLILKSKNTVISKNALAGSKISEIYIEETNETFNVNEYLYNYIDEATINNYLNDEATYLDLSSDSYNFTTVGDYAFSNKYNLDYIVFNDKVNTFNDYVLHGTDPNLVVYLNINKTDLNSDSSTYWNDGREVYYKGEWNYVDNIPTPIN